MLPDDVLLAIFDFCASEYHSTKKELEVWWRTLIHVHRRWRGLVFRSPRRLMLQLVCSAKTPARNTLDVWPFLPLSIHCNVGCTIESVDNIMAALERRDCVCRIRVEDVPSSHLERYMAAMQVPFLELTFLRLSSNDQMAVVPDSFLGGSAPSLKYLSWRGIPFPGLPKLLLSATHLVELQLSKIPHSGYFSPNAMATALSALTSLEKLSLDFQSPQSRPDWASRRPPPTTRSILPVLTDFGFVGVSEYLDDFVARIDAPGLNILEITLFNQIVFETPHFIQFISRTPMFKALEKAHVAFGARAAMVNFSTDLSSRHPILVVRILCRELDWQVSSLEQVFTSCLPPLSTLDLCIYKNPLSYEQTDWQDNIENALWLELLQPFTGLKNLYISKVFVPRIVPALQDLVGGRTTEVLPTLQNVFLAEHQPSGPVHEAIGEFIAARQVISRPITVSPWDFSTMYAIPEIDFGFFK